MWGWLKRVFSRAVDPRIPARLEGKLPDDEIAIRFVAGRDPLSDEDLRKALASPSLVLGGDTEIQFIGPRYTIDELVEKYGPDVTLADIKEAQEFQRAVADEPEPEPEWLPESEFMGYLPRTALEKFKPYRRPQP